MQRITTKLTYYVPKGLYCNLKMAKTTPATRCRFCTEVTKSNFVCALHNEPLLLEAGYLIQKTKDCLAAVKEIDHAK